MKRFAILLMSLMAVAAMAVPSGAAQPHRASGGANWQTGAKSVHTSFTAHEDGTGRITTAIWVDGSLEEVWHGTVTCYQSSGDEATFSGTVDGTGRYFVAKVVDHGEGKAAADQINSGRFDDDQQCHWPGWALKNVADGNIQVR